MRRWFVLLVAAMSAIAGIVAAPASAVTAPIGRLGDTLQVKFEGLIANTRGVTATGDAYEPRNTDAPDALQYALNNAPAGSTVSGAVFWDRYRDLVSNAALIDKITGEHLAQWNV